MVTDKVEILHAFFAPALTNNDSQASVLRAGLVEMTSSGWGSSPTFQENSAQRCPWDLMNCSQHWLLLLKRHCHLGKDFRSKRPGGLSYTWRKKYLAPVFRKNQPESPGIQQGQCPILHSGRKYTPQAEAWLRSNLVETVLVYSKLNIGQQCALAAKMANSFPGCVNGSIASRQREGMMPAPSTVHQTTSKKPWPWSTNAKKYMKQFQQRAPSLVGVLSICPVRRGLRNQACSTWRRDGFVSTNSLLALLAGSLRWSQGLHSRPRWDKRQWAWGEIRELQTGHTVKTFPHKDSPAVEWAVWRGYSVSILRGFEGPPRSPWSRDLVKTLSDRIILWSCR